MPSSFVAGLRAILLEAQFVNVLLPAPTRIAPPPVLPKGSFPQITIQQVIGEEVESLDGLSGLSDTTMQVNVWSPNYDEAFALRAAVIEILKDFSGAAGSTSLTIDRFTRFGYRELYDASLELHQLIVRCRAFWT